MQFTKPMIELVYEIRRRVPPGFKPSVKLANPELLVELTDHYRSSSDTICKVLIKELCELAGDLWLERLKEPKKPTPAMSLHVYRGTVKHSARVEESDEETAKRSAAVKKKIYRGRLVG